MKQKPMVLGVPPRGPAKLTGPTGPAPLELPSGGRGDR